MKLNELRPAKGAKKKRKVIGRGPGSGHGKTSTKGHKGQLARSGGGKGPAFEGGQMPLHRRLIKRGFHNPFKIRYEVVNLDTLDKYFKAGEQVTPDTLSGKGIIKRSAEAIKILSRGEISKPLSVKANKFSKKAMEMIVSAGGTAEVI